jgi:hypothetical protein
LETAEISQLIAELEERVERLRALYDQYFMGIERLEPLTLRKDVDRRLWALRREQIRNTGMRFKLETVIQRYNTYQQYWQRIVREIENGTYQRDVGRAAQRFGDNAVTAFAKRRQKMFEKGQAKKAERDARRTGASAPPPEPESSESFDVEFEDSELFADASPPLTLELGGSSAPPPRPQTVPEKPAAPRPLPPPPGAKGPLPKPVPPPPRPSAPSQPQARPPAPSQPQVRPPPPNPPPARPPMASRPEVRATTPSQPDVRPPAPSTPDDGLSATRLRQIYGQYVEAKRKANESTAAITFDKVAANLRETATQLRAKGKGTVDFEVVLKNGKPVLKPVVKG